ncbi:hypothetical protein LJ655_22740, partial [Paraburkholderia sp. MMS20-SJTN17]
RAHPASPRPQRSLCCGIAARLRVECPLALPWNGCSICAEYAFTIDQALWREAYFAPVAAIATSLGSGSGQPFPASSNVASLTPNKDLPPALCCAYAAKAVATLIVLAGGFAKKPY